MTNSHIASPTPKLASESNTEALHEDSGSCLVILPKNDDGGVTGSLIEDGIYEVESVVKKRVFKGELQYLIKWKGWPDSANSWEPFYNVKGCAEIIEEFEASLSNKRGKLKRKSGDSLSAQNVSLRSSESGSRHTEDGLDTISSSTNWQSATDSIYSDNARAESSEFAQNLERMKHKNHTRDEQNEFRHRQQSFGVEEIYSDSPVYGHKAIEIAGGKKRKIDSDEEPKEMALQKSANQKLEVFAKEPCQVAVDSDAIGCASSLRPEMQETAMLSTTSGANRRKREFVGHVPPKSLELQDNSKTNNEEDSQMVSCEGDPVWSQTVSGHATGTHNELVPSLLCNTEITVPPLTEILKVVNCKYSSVDGKQKVKLRFRVARADGVKVLADSKYLKANYPDLLIEYYEKHLLITRMENQ